MPSQGHLFIGETVSNEPEARAIYEKLGLREDPRHGIFGGMGGERQVHFRGEARTVYVYAHQQENGDAIVGFHLTNRYQGALLDIDSEHGRDEPFVVNMEELNALLSQTRIWWPEAQVILWDMDF